jgi:positive regulator of sigma E activity
MAEYRGPSVLGKVFTAFVLPLLSFIVAVAVFDKVTDKFELSKELEVVLSLVFGLITAIVAVFAVKILHRQFRKDRQD